MSDADNYSNEFLAQLRHFDVPIEDLRECIIGQDVRQLSDGIADMWTDMIDGWRSEGLSDEDVVNLFFHVSCMQLAQLESEGLVSEIENFLGEHCD